MASNRFISRSSYHQYVSDKEHVLPLWAHAYDTLQFSLGQVGWRVKSVLDSAEPHEHKVCKHIYVI